MSAQKREKKTVASTRSNLQGCSYDMLTLALALTFSASQLTVVSNRRVENNQTVAKALEQVGLGGSEIESIQSAMASTDFDFRKARVGDQLRVVFEKGTFRSLDYRRNMTTEWRVDKTDNVYTARKRTIDYEVKEALVDLTIDFSVWDAAIAAGEKPEVAVALSDVFAWDIDFYRDVQKGDRMRAVIEKVLYRGRVVDYKRVLAAEYTGQSVGVKRSYRYKLPDGTETYFAENGTSARKTFLKSPLKFAHITSGFGGRHHPILNYFGSHNGVDFGTPSGTPVWVTADGTVTRAGWDNGGGNMVCVKHILSFETCYLHLSRIAVRNGERVAQKTVLGESGSTGLSTGPHLHYAMKRGGKFVNPLNQNFPRSEPLPRELLEAFQQSIVEYKRVLDNASLAVVN
jgi:murein DD-endopeptidase MepM/ murein hydrolase activator NlpD